MLKIALPAYCTFWRTQILLGGNFDTLGEVAFWKSKATTLANHGQTWKVILGFLKKKPERILRSLFDAKWFQSIDPQSNVEYHGIQNSSKSWLDLKSHSWVDVPRKHHAVIFLLGWFDSINKLSAGITKNKGYNHVWPLQLEMSSLIVMATHTFLPCIFNSSHIASWRSSLEPKQIFFPFSLSFIKGFKVQGEWVEEKRCWIGMKWNAGDGADVWLWCVMSSVFSPPRIGAVGGLYRNKQNIRIKNDK